jgi:hypothetical protein
VKMTSSSSNVCPVQLSAPSPSRSCPTSCISATLAMKFCRRHGRSRHRRHGRRRGAATELFSVLRPNKAQKNYSEISTLLMNKIKPTNACTV